MLEHILKSWGRLLAPSLEEILEQLGDRTLLSGNSASAQAGALLPEQEGDNIVQPNLEIKHALYLT